MEHRHRHSSSKIAAQLSGNVLSESSRLFAFDIILKHINTMRMEADGVRWEAEDIEHIHRMRVASRRLRNTLVLFQSCFLENQARKWRRSVQLTTRTLGTARDLDVQIESLNLLVEHLPEKKYKAGIHRLILRLTQQRKKIQSQVIEIVNDLLKNNILNKIDQAIAPQMSGLVAGQPIHSPERQEGSIIPAFTSDLYLLARHAIHLRSENVLLYEEFIPEFNKDIEELHCMRKSAKWLRYTMEVFAPLYENRLKPYIHMTRQIQEYLGDIHDSDIWSQYIPVLLEKERKKTLKFYGHLRPLNPILPGINYFHHNWQYEREVKYREFLDSWQKWQAKGLFEQLLETVGSQSEIEVIVNEENPLEDTTAASPAPQPEIP